MMASIIMVAFCDPFQLRLLLTANLDPSIVNFIHSHVSLTSSTYPDYLPV
jgi:hypothetical protein